jgi:hypothetical protein
MCVCMFVLYTPCLYLTNYVMNLVLHIFKLQMGEVCIETVTEGGGGVDIFIHLRHTPNGRRTE